MNTNETPSPSVEAACSPEIDALLERWERYQGDWDALAQMCAGGPMQVANLEKEHKARSQTWKEAIYELRKSLSENSQLNEPSA